MSIFIILSWSTIYIFSILFNSPIYKKRTKIRIFIVTSKNKPSKTAKKKFPKILFLLFSSTFLFFATFCHEKTFLHHFCYTSIGDLPCRPTDSGRLKDWRFYGKSLNFYRIFADGIDLPESCTTHILQQLNRQQHKSLFLGKTNRRTFWFPLNF